jgi:hypothetical protein
MHLTAQLKNFPDFILQEERILSVHSPPPPVIFEKQDETNR